MIRPRVIVVAAVIERDGDVLIGQRRKGDRHSLKWEFPGGKVEFREHPRDALRRELSEELAIDAEIGPEITRYEFSYPKRTPLQLIFFRVTRFRGEPENKCFEQILWTPATKLPEFDFLEGDHDFVQRLAREALAR